MLPLSPDLASLLLAQAPDLLSLHDPAGTFRWASPAARTVLGCAPEELVGRSILDFVHPDEAPRVAAELARVVLDAAGAGCCLTYRVRSTDDAPVWLESTARAKCSGADDEAPTLVLITRDVSARDQVELSATLDRTELARPHTAPEQLPYWQALTDGLPEILWVADATGQTTQFLNRRWFDYTGQLPDVLKNQSWVRAIHPADLAESALQRAAQLSIAAGRAYETKFRLRRHDGAWRWFLTRAVPLRDEAGAITNWLGLTMDIHERELAERALRRANADLDTFVYAAAHDLKSPIDNLDSVIVALREEFGERVRAYPSPHDAGITKLHDHAERAVSRFRATLADLAQVVDLQTIESTRHQPLDLATYVADLALDMEAEFAAAHGTLCLDLRVAVLDALPARHLRSVLFNLIGNALKYRQPDRPARLWLRTRAIGASWVELALTDNGLGLDSAKAARAFELFGRLHPGAAGGTGIGLFIVRRVIEQAGGKLRVNGRVGEGTTFAIRLPRH